MLMIMRSNCFVSSRLKCSKKRSSHVSRNTNIYFEISIQESNMKMFIFLRLRYRQIASWTLNSFFTETRLMQKSLIAKIEHKFHHICDVSSFLQKIMMINNYTPPGGQGPGVMTLIFAVSDSWGLFTQNIFPGKNRMKNCPLGGSPKWDRQIWKKYFFHFEKQYLLIFKW